MTDRRRSAFTMIELMIVICIMALLAALSAPAVVRTTRLATFNGAGSAIEDLHTQAQLLAMRSPPGNDRRYGVRLSLDGSGRISAQVIRSDSGAAVTEVPGLLAKLPPVVRLWSNGEPMAADTSLEWFYESGTGLPCIIKNGGFSPGGAMLGVVKPDLSALPGGADMAKTLPILAEQTGSEPGLELCTRDRGLKASLALYPSGILVIGERK